MTKPIRSEGILVLQRRLYLLSTLIWTGLGVVTLARGASAAASAGTMVVIGVLMFGNAAAFALAGWRIVYRKPLDLMLAAAVLGVNIVLTFTDQMGFLDWATLALDLLLAALLVPLLVSQVRRSQQ